MRIIDAHALQEAVKDQLYGYAMYTDIMVAPSVCCEWCDRDQGKNRCFIRAQASEDWQMSPKERDAFGCSLFVLINDCRR